MVHTLNLDTLYIYTGLITRRLGFLAPYSDTVLTKTRPTFSLFRWQRSSAHSSTMYKVDTNNTRLSYSVYHTFRRRSSYKHRTGRYVYWTTQHTHISSKENQSDHSVTMPPFLEQTCFCSFKEWLNKITKKTDMYP